MYIGELCKYFVSVYWSSATDIQIKLLKYLLKNCYFISFLDKYSKKNTDNTNMYVFLLCTIQNGMVLVVLFNFDVLKLAGEIYLPKKKIIKHQKV